MPAQSAASDQLALLFGDTWASPTDGCAYPELKSDDLFARIPAMKPASLNAGQTAAVPDACNTLQYTLDDSNDPTTWRRIRLFPDAGDRTDDRVLDTGMLRTPLTAFSDGTHLIAIFIRDEYARCQNNSQCPTGSVCTKDANYQGKHLGGCQPHVTLTSDASPALCRDDSDCPSPGLCTDIDPGVCVATEPFVVQRGEQRLSPSWYTDDPRNGLVSSLRIASSFWPDRPEDFATGFEFATNKFTNLTARTVSHFDPQHPENNDYTPGDETLLVWGRPSFIARNGFQALPFLLYQPLANLVDDSNGQIAWAPQFFAGYDGDGNPAWSAAEADAQPLYGVDENLVQQPSGQLAFDWRAPEFDYVNQMSMTWLAPLQRWVMVYGGETAAVSDPATGKRPAPTYSEPVSGAIHLRSSTHPFGRAHASSPAAEGFSSARAVLAPAAVASQLACPDDAKSSDPCTSGLPVRGGNLLDSIVSAATEPTSDDFLSASAKCAAGSAALNAQYSIGDDSGGHLYGAAIIEPWTQDVTGMVSDVPSSEPVVEIYWNVSTWNPYQVLLIKSQLRASDFAAR